MSETPTITDRDAAQDFLGQFLFNWSKPQSDFEDLNFRRRGYGPPCKKYGGEALDERHPFYKRLKRQADNATTVVRHLEQFLNRSDDLLVMPVRVQCDPPVRGEERAIGIGLAHEKWRLMIYSWRWHDIAKRSEVFRPRVAWSRKRVWLEAAWPEKVWTIKHLPDLLNAMLKQCEELVRRGGENDGVLDRVTEVLSVVAGPLPKAGASG